MTSAVLLFDNASIVPHDISNLLGVSRYSDIYYRKRSLDRWIADICAAAGIDFVELAEGPASSALTKRLEQANLVVLYIPSFMAFGCPEEDAALFLRKLSLTRSCICVTESDAAAQPSIQVAALTGQLARHVLQTALQGGNLAETLAEARHQMHSVPSDVHLIDMRDPLRFTDYLTSNFDVRFFNSVQSVNDFTVEKRSSDARKLRREYQYYGLLPAELQTFFIQPYAFHQEGNSASYRMERLFVPDMALQWIHGSLDERSLKRFFDKIFHYIDLRPAKAVDKVTAQSVYQDAYRTKVKERLQQLKTLSEFDRLSPYLDVNFGGIDALFNRYFTLLDQADERPQPNELRLGHGDLCFSNILYSKTTDLMRFIDPRGADSQDDLYLTPLYDLAKLSHSVIGNYDFINYGLFQLEIDQDLQLSLHIEQEVPTWARPMFEQHLRQNGFDPCRIRLLEASLFLSMAPLHIDSPRKVLAFLVNAGKILAELESQS